MTPSPVLSATVAFNLLLLLLSASGTQAVHMTSLDTDDVDVKGRGGAHGQAAALAADGEFGRSLLQGERTAGACASQRCDGFTDADGTGHPLKFRDPSKDYTAEPMNREQVANIPGLAGYHHGVLSDCQPLGVAVGAPGRTRTTETQDWATDMEHVGEGYSSEGGPAGAYMCAEKCTLTFFDAAGRPGSKQVWVDREGKNGIFNIGKFADGFTWKPPVCKVGNDIQQNWWEQLRTYRIQSNADAEVMVTTKGLPLWRLDPDPERLQTLLEDFTQKFCALGSNAERNTVVLRSETCNRPLHSGKEQWTNIAKNPVQCLPSGFPTSCKKEDGTVTWALAEQTHLKVRVRA